MKHSKKLRLLAVLPESAQSSGLWPEVYSHQKRYFAGCLSAVISGRVNTKRLIEILEREWGESIEAIREIHQNTWTGSRPVTRLRTKKPASGSPHGNVNSKEQRTWEPEKHRILRRIT